MIASIIGYAVSSAFMGFQPLFGFAAPGFQFDPAQLGWFALIGVVGGFMGLAYSSGFYGLVGVFERIPVPRLVRPAIGGVLVGSLAVALPGVLGTGYGWVQKALGQPLLGTPMWVVLALPFAKILATSLSIGSGGSGGSGGIFGPGMVIGAFTGAAVWRVLEPIAPAVPHNPAPFVIVGMMATFGSICRAPLAVMLMVAEMTGSLTALAPAMLAVGLATLIVRHFDRTIYRSQLKSRADSPAHRLQRSMPLLGSLAVTHFMAPPRVVLSDETPVAEALSRMDDASPARPSSTSVTSSSESRGAGCSPTARPTTAWRASVGSRTRRRQPRHPATISMLRWNHCCWRGLTGFPRHDRHDLAARQRVGALSRRHDAARRRSGGDPGARRGRGRRRPAA